MLLFLLILLAIVCSISLFIVIVLFRLWRNPVPEDMPRDEDEESYYDENGDHIYYDRKLIAYKKRHEAQGAQNKK